MTDFEKSYEIYLKASADHVYLDQLLAKLSVLAGLVYDPSQDASMDSQLAELSRQIYVLRVYDELQSFLIHSNHREHPQPMEGLKDILAKAGSIDSVREGAEANYPKILGWVLAAAKERKLFRP